MCVRVCVRLSVCLCVEFVGSRLVAFACGVLLGRCYLDGNNNDVRVAMGVHRSSNNV